jgi:hypothetical protein
MTSEPQPSAPLNEQNVDEDLTSFLEKPIPKTNKRTFTEAFQEKVVDDEEDENKLPAFSSTKDAIYREWSKASGEQGAELLPMVEKVAKLTEAQAKAYLSCLHAVHTQNTHRHLSSRLLYAISRNVCHPDDPLTPLAMEEDPYLLNGISSAVSEILFVVGRLAIPLLFCAYASTSWWYTRQTETRGDRVLVAKSGAATSTVQNDGVCPIPNGENITHDQVNDEGMDSHLR